MSRALGRAWSVTDPTSRRLGLFALATCWLLTLWVSLTFGNVPTLLAACFVASWGAGVLVGWFASRREVVRLYALGMGFALLVVVVTYAAYETTAPPTGYQAFVRSLPLGEVVLAAGITGLLLAAFAVILYVVVAVREDLLGWVGNGRPPEARLLTEEEYATFDRD